MADIFNSSMTNSNNITHVTNDSPMAPSLDYNLSDYWTYRVATQIYSIVPFVLFSAGLIGNGLALAVFLLKTMRKYSSYIYLAGLAIFDNLALTSYMLSAVGSKSYYPDMSTVAFCKIISFLQSWAHHVTSWLVVMVTVDRLIATAIPFRAGVLCTPKRATIVMIAVVTVSAAINLHLFWSITSVTNPTHCAVLAEHQDFLQTWSWIDISLYSFIPSILLFVFNIIIGYFIKTAWNRQCKLTNNKNNVPRGVFSKQITIVLILVSVSFLVFTLPASSVYLYQFITKPQQRAVVEGRLDIYADYIYINQIVSIFLQLNHCFNILMYSMSGSRFRQELMNVLKCRCGTLKRMEQQIRHMNLHPISSDTSTGSKSIQSTSSCTNSENGVSDGGITNKAFECTDNDEKKKKCTQERKGTNNISIFRYKGFKSGSYDLQKCIR